MNIFESLFRSATQPEPPLHAGEAFLLWAYYESAAETRAILQVLLNHTEDKDLRELTEHFIADVLEPQISRAKEMLLREGMNIPDVTQDHPKADATLIPVGARFTDEQVANMHVVKIQGLLMFCSEGLARSLRDDLGAMYYAFQAQVLGQGATLKSVMSQRGWLRVPPSIASPPTRH